MNKLLLIVSTCAAMILLAMMFLTSPSTVGPAGVLVFFTTSYLFFLGLAVLCCRLFFILRGKLNKAKRPLNLDKKSLRYGVVVALAPVILMLIGSFGGISILEIAITCILEVLLCFLTSRNVI
jgi:nitrogen fixation/metabolism regulation signal transduction histidine kinase